MQRGAAALLLCVGCLHGIVACSERHEGAANGAAVDSRVAGPPTGVTADRVGQNAPEFKLPALRVDAQGRRVDGLIELSAYRGKVVYLDFWGSWCE